MFNSFFVILSSLLMVFTMSEIQAGSSEKVKERYSFRKGKKNQKYMDQIKERGGKSYSALFW